MYVAYNYGHLMTLGLYENDTKGSQIERRVMKEGFSMITKWSFRQL